MKELGYESYDETEGDLVNHNIYSAGVGGG